ncbi:MAG: UDP-3-O-(3-hydroxymyristoyl)glucosamine N-acyltransferase [Myxococcota bacterium]|nr:UDP-3-O-(3-hydroxymyristoyl)glucosamine N-acyltransferase [Myxococcota bacterium]
MATLRLRALAERLGGREVEADGDPELVAVASLDEAGPGALSFVRSARFQDALARTAAAAVVAPPGVDTGKLPTLRSPNPNLDFARAAALLHPEPPLVAGIHPSAVVEEGAEIAEDVFVGPLSFVAAGARVGSGTRIGARVCIGAGAVVGADCVIREGGVLAHGVRLGDRVIVQPGAVVGGDGFGYELDERGQLEKVPQVGTVEIGDDVEIGANATIDRARLGTTRIGRGSKIDNLVQIGHNCVLGEHTVVVSQAGLAGSTTLEDRVVVMAQAGLANHVTVGRGSILAARAGAFQDLPAGSRVFGFPALPGRAWHRSIKLFERLPELFRRLRALERKVDADAPHDEVELK